MSGHRHCRGALARKRKNIFPNDADTLQETQLVKKICGMLKNAYSLGFELKGSIIYYCGLCSERLGRGLGSFEPAASGRIVGYAPGISELRLVTSRAVKRALLDSEGYTPRVIDKPEGKRSLRNAKQK